MSFGGITVLARNKTFLNISQTFVLHVGGSTEDWTTTNSTWQMPDTVVALGQQFQGMRCQLTTSLHSTL